MQRTPFAPTLVSGLPFQFDPVLDGRAHSASIYWSEAGQRWDILLLAPNGVLVFNMALVGSPVGQAIESLTWENGFAFGKTVVPTSFRVGDTRELVISDCVPVGYNGRHRLLLTGLDTFSYPLADNPGLVTNFGAVSYDIDMMAGYGYDSTLVYREANAQFEVGP